MLLESMKKGVSKFVIQILAVLLIASFAVWGLEDMVGVIANPDEVATVGGQPVTQREFEDQFRQELSRLRSRIGNIDIEQARALGIGQSTLNGIVSRRLLGLQAHDLGLLIGDDLVIQRIQEEPGFRNSLGQFDRAVFEATLANNGMSEGMYVAALRQDLQQEYITGAISGGLTAPPQLARSFYQFRNERRSAEVIEIKHATPDTVPAPSEAALAEYLKKNAAGFMSPEYRKLTVLHLDPDEIAKELSPAPDRIQEEYEARLSSLSVPERRHLEQILLKSEDDAKKAHSTLSGGKAFADVASEMTGKSGDDIKLGDVTRTDLLPAIADAAFTVPEGGFTEPVKSPLGWHILRVSKIEPGKTPPLSDVEDEIKAELARELALDDLVKRANKLEDALAGGATIDEAASEIGARTTSIDPIDANLRLQTGTAATGVPRDGRFIETAFSTERGNSSDLIETQAGGYFMVRVDDVIASAEQPLDKIREAVTAAWKRDNLDAATKKIADEILAQAKTGRPMSTIAEDRKLTVVKGGPATRFPTGSESTIPAGLLPGLFEAKKGESVLAQTASGYAVARLTEVETAGIDAESDNYKRLQESLTAALANDILQEFTRALRSEYDVEINQAGLEAYYRSRQY